MPMDMTYVFYTLKGFVHLIGKKNIKQEKERYGLEFEGNTIALHFTDRNKTVYLKMTDDGLKFDIRSFINKDPDVTVSMTTDTYMNIIDGRIKLQNGDGSTYFEDYTTWDAVRFGDIQVSGERSTNMGKKALQIFDDNIPELREIVREARK